VDSGFDLSGWFLKPESAPRLALTEIDAREKGAIHSFESHQVTAIVNDRDVYGPT
jgi:hypothetical protein